MSLADLSTSLDATGVVSQLFGDLSRHVDALHAVGAPVDDSRMASATRGAATDTSGIAGAIAGVAGAVEPLLAQLPGVGDVLAPINAAVAVATQLSSGDLRGKVERLIDAFRDAATGSEGDTIAMVSRLAKLLDGAPEGQALFAALRALLGAAHVDLPADAFAVGEPFVAIESTARVFGGLMAIASVLTEAERLTGVMAAQLDPAAIDGLVQALLASFGDGDTRLAEFVRRVDVDSPPEVDAAVQAVLGVSAALERLRVRLAEGMGFGQATLVYLDVGKVQLELSAASALVTGANMDAIGRAARSLAARLAPVTRFRPDLAAAGGLSALLGVAESKVGELTTAIAGFDAVAVVHPLTEALGAIDQVLATITGAIDQVTHAIRAALEQVRQIVHALPLHTITDAVHTVLAPIAQALDAIRALIDEVEAALHTAADATQAVLGQIEGVLDTFKDKVDVLFGGAKQLVDQLRLDQVIGEVADQIKAFSALLARAQMKPYFDTAAGAIQTTADVIDKIPFGLLPASMKSQVDDAVRPIKETDAHAVQVEIESLLQITDGKFQLRDEIDAAVEAVQAKYEALIAAIEAHNPRQYLAQLDDKLGEIAQKIRELTPALSLQPIQSAIDDVKRAIGSFDLRAQLAPVHQVFQRILDKIDEYSPTRLLEPVQRQVQLARARIISAIALDQWAPLLDGLVAQVMTLVGQLDPARLEARLRDAFAQLQALLSRADGQLAGELGNVLASLLSGSGLRIHGWTFELVLGWLGGGGSSDVVARAGRIADATVRTRDAVRGLDVAAIIAQVAPRLAEVRAAIASLPSGDARTRLGQALARIDVDGVLGAVAANRTGYLVQLEASAIQAETLRRTGLSEVDAAITRVRSELAPLAPALQFATGIFGGLGLPTGLGLGDMLRALLAVATPERLIGLVMPLFGALRDRLVALLAAIATPLRDAVRKLNELIARFDLRPLMLSVDSIVEEVKGQISSLDPLVLLEDTLDSFDALKATVLAFDPLHDVLAILDQLRDAAARLLDKLDPEAILATPLAIFDHLLAELKKLDVRGLLDPLLDELDQIAAQVDSGLTETVGAFQHLQAALPGGGGGSSASLSASVGVG